MFPAKDGVGAPKKKTSRRRVSLPETLVRLLGEYRRIQTGQRKELRRPLKDDDPIFTRADGTALGPATVSHAFKRVSNEAGLKGFRLHNPRHPYVSLLLKAGKHPSVVAAQLGHSSVRTTLDVYSHVLPGLQEAAARSLDQFMPRQLSEGSQ